MPAVCSICDAPLEEFLHGEVAEGVPDKIIELHDLEAVKIDHVRRGEPQECWACGEETKGFHLYKSSTDFYKLCDACAQHVATFLAHLVKHQQEEREKAREDEAG